MNKLFTLIIIIVVLISCDSPFDVPASSGDPIVIDDPYLKNPIIDVDPEFIDLGIIIPDQNIEFTIEVFNITDKQVVLDSANFYQKLFTNNFEKTTLSPKNTTDFQKEFSIYFNKENPGVYRDSLIFDDMLNPSVKVKASVAFVYAEDLTFEPTEKGVLTGGLLNIYNLTDQTVQISEMEFKNGNIFNFTQIPNFPYELRPGKNEILLKFKPENAIEYIDTLDIQLSSSVIYKNFAVIKGKGI